MTEAQTKKYEEAAKAHVDNLGDDPPDHRDLRYCFLAGATFAHNEAESKKIDIGLIQKEAHNAAIQEAIELIVSDLDGPRHELMQELEKLKL
jgi:hypothetical protein